MNTRWLNFLERVLWTLVQAASAEGILTVWESLHGPLPASEHASLVVTLTTLLAVIKNAVTQAAGSPTGATLPDGIRPVPAESTVTVNQVQSAVETAVTSALTSLLAPKVAGVIGAVADTPAAPPAEAPTPPAVVTDNGAGPGQIPDAPAAPEPDPQVPAVDNPPVMPTSAPVANETPAAPTISGVV